MEAVVSWIFGITLGIGLVLFGIYLQSGDIKAKDVKQGELIRIDRKYYQCKEKVIQ